MARTIDNEGRQKTASAVHTIMGRDENVTKFTNRILSGDHDDLALLTITALLRQSPHNDFSELSKIIFVEMESIRLENAISKQGQLWIDLADSPPMIYRSPAPLPASLDKHRMHFRSAISPYPPCTRALSELTPINLANLRMETHHRGKALNVTRTGYMVYGRTRILGTVVDAFGWVGNFELYNCDWTLGENVVPRSAFAIKEPYLTFSLEATPVVRIDHPTDIVSSDSIDHSSAASWYDGVEQEEMDQGYFDPREEPDHWKQRPDLVAHISAATERQGPDPGQHPPSVHQEPCDGNGGARTGLAEVERHEDRWTSRGHDIICYAEVESSPGHGNGLFAAKDLGTGDMVLREREVCSSVSNEKSWYKCATYDARYSGYQMSIGSGDLRTKLLQECIRDPKLAAQITRLSGKYPGLGTDEIICDGVRVVDAFQIGDIVSRNAFDISHQRPLGVDRPSQFSPATGEPFSGNAGIYLRASMMNHSCLPNAHWITHGDVLVVRAIRPIRRGEEILISYHGRDSNLSYRQERMERMWDFRCDCALCDVEKAESTDVQAHRLALEDEAFALATASLLNQSTTELDATIASAERILRDIKATYAHELYDSVPRLVITRLLHDLDASTEPSEACAPLQTALAYAYLDKEQYSKCLEVITEAFDCLGWDFDIGRNVVSLGCREHSQLNSSVSGILACAAFVVDAETPHAYEYNVRDVLVALARVFEVVWSGTGNEVMKEILIQRQECS